MKLRVIATLCLALALGVGSASAQSIGVYFDANGGTCSTAIAPNTPFTMYMIANLGGATSGGITGAEFRMDGFPAGWFGTPSRNPAANIDVGNPMNGGTNLAFPSCQAGSGGRVLLFTINGFATSAVVNRYFQILQHTTPSNPNFVCPLVTICDAVFTKICVTGGVAIVNGPPCTVAVQPASWSAVKEMFN
jgi:hypothetical protein